MCTWIYYLFIIFNYSLSAMNLETLEQQRVEQHNRFMQMVQVNKFLESMYQGEVQDQIIEESCKIERLKAVRKEITELVRRKKIYERLAEFDIQQYGIDVLDKNETLLCVTLYERCYGLAKLVLEANADVNKKSGDNLNTPLMYAVCGAPASLVRDLLLKGAIRDELNGNGHSAIMLALWYYYFHNWHYLNEQNDNPVIDDPIVANQRVVISLITNQMSIEATSIVDANPTVDHFKKFKENMIRFGYWDIFAPAPLQSDFDDSTNLYT